MHLKARMLVLVVPVKIHVHSTIKEPAIWQILALDSCLNRFNLFRFQIINLSQGFFRFWCSPTISKHFFDYRISSFRDVSPVNQKSKVIRIEPMFLVFHRL